MDSPWGTPGVAVHNVATTVGSNSPVYTSPDNSGYYYQRTRVGIGKVLFQPLVATIGGMYVTMGVAGTTPSYIYDMVEHSTVVYISQYSGVAAGEGMRWTNMMAHCYNTVYEPVGNTTAGALAVYDEKLWRSRPISDQIAYYQPTESTVGKWSSWVDVKPGIRIMRMAEFIGRLMIGANDGLYAYEAGRTYRVMSFEDDTSRDNFMLMSVMAGSLWFNIGERLFRYTSGGLLEEMSVTIEEGEIPMRIVSGPNCVYMMCGDISTGQRSVYRVDINLGSTQILDASVDDGYKASIYDPFGSEHCTGRPDEGLPMPTLFRIPGERITLENARAGNSPLVFGPVTDEVSGTVLTQNWLNFGDPITTLRTKGTEQNFTAERYLETGMIDMGYPLLAKSWQRVRLKVSNQPLGTDTFESVYYRTSNSLRWMLTETKSYSSNDRDGYVTFDFPNGGVVSREIELKPYLAMLSTNVSKADVPMTLDRVELDAMFIGPVGNSSLRRRRMITFRSNAVNNLKRINMETENSAAYVQQTLWSIMDSGQAHVVSLPYPPPTGHTTKAIVSLGDEGAHVPVVAYTVGGDHSIGVHFPVVITEV